MSRPYLSSSCHPQKFIAISKSSDFGLFTTTTLDRHANMHYESRWPLSPPSISVPSFIFISPSATLPTNEHIIIDCQHPAVQYFTLHSLRQWSKRFAAGLVATGLQQGDRVMLVSKNSFWSPVLILGVLMAGRIQLGPHCFVHIIKTFAKQDLDINYSITLQRFILYITYYIILISPQDFLSLSKLRDLPQH